MVGAPNTEAYWVTRFLAHCMLVQQQLALHGARAGQVASEGGASLAAHQHPVVRLLGAQVAAGTLGAAPVSTTTVGRAFQTGYAAINGEIGSQRRLRVTKGIYLPADVPMHGVFGSKDVIHSWAIPGLGVKIDCIPGFSSHRRLVLRWRGLFWGQCMEVCGRYHHWMPILVRVVHKDVFLA